MRVSVSNAGTRTMLNTHTPSLDSTRRVGRTTGHSFFRVLHRTCPLPADKGEARDVSARPSIPVSAPPLSRLEARLTMVQYTVATQFLPYQPPHTFY